jgi:WD40 repeat protein
VASGSDRDVVRVMGMVRIAGQRGLMTVAVATVIALLAGLSAAAPAAGSVSSGHGASAASGAQLWASRYNGPANSGDDARAAAVSPDGGTVFVTGNSGNGDTPGGSDFATVAYDTATGAQLWARRYHDPGNGFDNAVAVAVSPDGGMVFVTGTVPGSSDNEYATVAYDAATGAQLWARRYHGPHNGASDAAAVAVSPAGGTVFVTGTSVGLSVSEYATVAYDAATGAQLWVRRFHRGGAAEAESVAVSPGGGRLYVTGATSNASGHNDDYATVAYNAVTGARLWVGLYQGPRRASVATSVAVGPGGRSVYVTGSSKGRHSSTDYATVAYNGATGKQQWFSRYNGPGTRLFSGRLDNHDDAFAVAVSPGGRSVFVTGKSRGTRSWDYATVAYNGATGKQRWVKRYNDPRNGRDDAFAVGVSPHGGRVYVTGFSSGISSDSDFLTVAYNAASGAPLWVRRANGPLNNTDEARALVVSPATGTVFVTGESFGTTTSIDYLTIAYQG